MGRLSLENVIYRITRMGVLASALLLTLGLMSQLIASKGRGDLWNQILLKWGIFIIIFIPILSLASSALLSIRRRDLLLALTSTLVLLVLLMGVAIGFV